ncbi:hypothetical protein C8J57DRAFT_1227336 [Mycena rebaudengoi]|nr:hypothetical protein C8J57DRAFT_1227336 [Mycena rebaudengoi]
MQDPEQLYHSGFHPVNYCMNTNHDALAHSLKRTACWPRYYIIDFGLSRRYSPAKGPPTEPTPTLTHGDKAPPEYAKRDRIHMPLQFLQPLVEKMTKTDPVLRPTIGEVIQRFDAAFARLGEWELRRPGQALGLGSTR